MQCKLRKSYMANLYYTWVEIINFNTISAGQVLRVMIGKVVNPASKQFDINFLIKVNTITAASKI